MPNGYIAYPNTILQTLYDAIYEKQSSIADIVNIFRCSV